MTIANRSTPNASGIGFNGYIDCVRVSNIDRYRYQGGGTTYTVPTVPYLPDLNTTYINEFNDTFSPQVDQGTLYLTRSTSSFGQNYNCAQNVTCSIASPTRTTLRAEPFSVMFGFNSYIETASTQAFTPPVPLVTHASIAFIGTEYINPS